MKKCISTALILILLLFLCGCEQKQETYFYYPRTQIQYGVSNGVISGEPRDLSDMENDLEYILKVYLEGPVSVELRSPFPKGTALVSIVQENDSITLILSEPFSNLETLDYTIACACVASTCFSLTEAESVTVQAGDSQLTLTRENLSLVDQAAATIPE